MQGDTPELVALRIPAGWMIEQNCFFEAEPVAVQGQLSSALFDEDLLHLRFDHPEGPYILTLGWLPPTDPKGRYVLRLFAEDFRKPALKEFEGRDWREIQKHVDQWLQAVGDEE